MYAMRSQIANLVARGPCAVQVARPALCRRCFHSSVRSQAQQQGQSFSQLKEDPQETTEVVFDPMKEASSELATVEKQKMNSPKIDDALARVWYAEDSEAAVNEQINHEYTMSYVYHAMSSYFNRDNVALPGLAAFFRANSLEERSHAQMLMDFQSTRGGRVKLATLAAPESNYGHEEKGDALHAMELALSLEKLNFQYLYNLHEVADKNNDAQFADFVETMLEEQADGVKEVADYVAKLRRVGKGLGVYQFDQEIAQRAAALGQPSGTSTVTAPEA